MAREHQLDLGDHFRYGQAGPGVKGRCAEFSRRRSQSVQAQASVPGVLSPGVVAEDRVEVIRGVRKIMAERMAESVATIPHFTFVDELDVTELVAAASTPRMNGMATDDT